MSFTPLTAIRCSVRGADPKGPVVGGVCGCAVSPHLPCPWTCGFPLPLLSIWLQRRCHMHPPDFGLEAGQVPVPEATQKRGLVGAQSGRLRINFPGCLRTSGGRRTPASPKELARPFSASSMSIGERPLGLQRFANPAAGFANFVEILHLRATRPVFFYGAHKAPLGSVADFTLFVSRCGASALMGRVVRPVGVPSATPNVHPARKRFAADNLDDTYCSSAIQGSTAASCFQSCHGFFIELFASMFPAGPFASSGQRFSISSHPARVGGGWGRGENSSVRPALLQLPFACSFRRQFIPSLCKLFVISRLSVLFGPACAGACSLGGHFFGQAPESSRAGLVRRFARCDRPTRTSGLHVS